MSCGASFAPVEFPDATNGVPCCYGYAFDGPTGCTCWKAIYDLAQQPMQQGPMQQRSRMCGDCAFRAGSPERSGDQRYAHSGEQELALMVDDARAVFACHTGVRRVVAYEHPTGARVEIEIDAYHAPQARGHAVKADGSPAELCAGLARARRTIERQTDAA